VREATKMIRRYLRISRRLVRNCLLKKATKMQKS